MLTLNVIILISLFILVLNETQTQVYPTIKELRNTHQNSGTNGDFVRVDLGISEKYPNTRILHYLDVNNDKFTDMIGVNRKGNQERPVFFLYNPIEGQFSEYQELTGVHYQNAFIKNIIANDFNQDGFIDLMITVYYKDLNETSSQILLYDTQTSIYKKAYEFPNHNTGILIADLGETRGLDFLFFDEISGTRKFLYFDTITNLPVVKDFSSLISSDKSICDRSNIHINYPLTEPHSSSFVDIDGDCINDLLIMSNTNFMNDALNKKESKFYLEIWHGIIEDKEIKYCLTQSSVYNLDPKLGLFSLADINRDAMLDIVFPVLDSAPPQILIAYNKIKLEYDWTADYCATQYTNKYSNLGVNKKLIIPLLFDEFTISTPVTNNKNTNTNTIGGKNIRNLYLSANPEQTFFNDHKLYENGVPIPFSPNEIRFPVYLRFGDINMDSYPDFTVVLHEGYASNCYVFLNHPEEIEIGGVMTTTDTSDRIYSYEKAYFNPFVSNVVYSSFFDMDEDGKLDLMIVKEENTDLLNTEGYYNSRFYDSFYLKSMVLGTNTGYSNNELGNTFRFITTNLDGSRRMDLSSQGAQSSARLGLNLPYAYVGIGRSNNYIENFQVISGNFVQQEYNYKTFTPIIPNSQIVVRHFKNENYEKLMLEMKEKEKNTPAIVAPSTVEPVSPNPVPTPSPTPSVEPSLVDPNKSSTEPIINPGPITPVVNPSPTPAVNPSPSPEQVTPVPEEKIDLVTWQLELLVKPTKSLSVLIAIIIFILSCLFVGIAYLHIKESKEDSVENQREFQFW